MAYENKTVFVTGGAQGFGLAFVEKFLEEGAKVGYGDVNKEQGNATQEELRAKYGHNRLCFIPCDITNDSQFKACVAETVKQFGPIDIFINNAGILNEGIWEKMIEINVTGTVRGTKIALEHMRKDKGGKGGRIVNLCSIMGFREHPSTACYNATKHAIRAYTTSVAMMDNLVSEMGIEICALCPDAAKTDLNLKLDDTKFGNHAVFKERLENMLMPVLSVVDALCFMLHQKEINGALLVVKADGYSFHKMEIVDTGLDYPAPKAGL